MSEKTNLLVLQTGGPTVVVNTSLYGVIDQGKRVTRFSEILGSQRGVMGLLHDDVTELSAWSAHDVDRLRRTPGAALGSSRHRLTGDDYDLAFDTLDKHNVGALIIIGGNGSMCAAHELDRAAAARGVDLSVVGVPKTVDNDIAETDRCPGYASAARFVVQSVRDVGQDVRSLPLPVSIFETMGRNTGWLAGAAGAARYGKSTAPHALYLPEHPFSVDTFLGDIDRFVTSHGWTVVVVSEGVRDADGQPVYRTQIDAQKDDLGRALPGGVSSYLAAQVSNKLILRCRYEQPGLCGRTSMAHVSPIDAADAEHVGRAAIDAVVHGERGVMVALLPVTGDGASPRSRLVALDDVVGVVRPAPRDWLTPAGNDVTDEFVQYVRTLIGQGMWEYE